MTTSSMEDNGFAQCTVGLIRNADVLDHNDAMQIIKRLLIRDRPHLTLLLYLTRKTSECVAV